MADTALKLYHISVSNTDTYEVDHMVVVATDRDEAASLYCRETGYYVSHELMTITDIDMVSGPDVVFRTYVDKKEDRRVEYL